MNDLSPAATITRVAETARIGDGSSIPPSMADALPPDGAAEESLLRYYWRVLIKRRWVIAGVLLGAVLAGLLMAMLSQKLYSATITLEIAREGSRVINIEDAQPRPGANQEFYQTQYALLKSRSIAEMVVRDLRLANNTDFLTNYESGGEPAVALGSRADREARAVGIIMNNLEVIPVRLSSVVNVRFVSPDGRMAADVANSVADNFIESNLARRYEASAYARQFLEGRLEQMRQRLEQSERQAVAYAAQQQIINIAPLSRDPETPAQEQSLVAAQLAALNSALGNARTARIVAEERYRRATGGAAAQAGLENSAINNLRQQRAALSAEYERQLSNLGPEYPTVAALRAQLRELDQQISGEVGRVRLGVSSNLEGEYRQAVGAEQRLAANVEQLKSEMLDLRRRSIQYNIYQREVDTNRALYDALLQRYREIGIAGGVGANNVSIVDRAQIPSGPFSPNLPLTVMLSLLVGAALGVAAALILEQLDEATVAPAEFQNKLGIPLLGAVPKLQKGEDAQQVLADRKAALSEAYMSVLTGLQLSTTHGMPKSLVVTSAQASEGKSTTAYALAQGLARLGSKVLLIDADMRNPSLHKSLGLRNDRGLSNLLAGDGKLSTTVQEVGMPNLSALVAGRLPPSPAELLAGGAMERVLDEAGQAFDHIVIDGPPILGLADAPLLGRVAEATIFVLEFGRTRATQARHALNRLIAAHAPVAGAVLTKFDMQKSGYGYGYGYDYSYGS